MRLSKLKLAGFKTFVDPTTVHAPGNLVGVVGPNGCGKSNIIDAVRWVLGESRASALRGESMQDVIFNGSTTRKPVSRASVELVFDNAEGKAAGQWSQYAEISVKRVLDRSGESSYFINGAKVRRKDVVDLFLGTGLGPRAYAIIEQGMISRIIEARPEEIRGFLEEAAGVTKYRERRRETEGRLSDARDNLARLDDIRMELGERIEHLSAQAEVAARYRELRDAHAERQDLLWLLKRNQARDEAGQLQQQVADTGREMEAGSARLQTLEATVEAGREAHMQASEAVNGAQGELYAAAAEVSRLEAEGQRLRDNRDRIERRLRELGDEKTHWQRRKSDLLGESERWRELLENARLRAEEAVARHEEAAAQLPELEDMAAAAEATTQAVRRELAQVEQQLRVQEAHRASARRALEALAERRARLGRSEDAPAAPDTLEIARIEAEIESLDGERAGHEDALATLQAELPQRQAAAREATAAERAAHKASTEARARLQALSQLQARVRERGELGAWLARHGIDANRPLWQQVQLEAGWEAAFEAVLRERLSAFAIERQESLADLIADPAPASVSLMLDPQPGSDDGGCPPGCRRLRELVRCDDVRIGAALDDWLRGHLCCDDDGRLPALRSALGPGQRLVARDGQLLDGTGLTRLAGDGRTHGVLERQREIEELETHLTALGEAAEQARQRVQEAEAAWAGLQESQAARRQQAQALQQRTHALQVEHLKLTQAKQRADEHVARVAHDLAELAEAEKREQAHLQAAESELARAGEMANLQSERLASAEQTLRERHEALRSARASEQAIAREVQELGFTERECAGKLDDNARNLGVADEQLLRIGHEYDSRLAEREGCDDEASRAALQQAVALHAAREATLAGARDRLAEAGQRLRDNEAMRLRTEQEVAPLRDRLSELRLALQAAELSCAQCQERLDESRADEERLEPLLAEGPREGALAREVARLAREIEALGAVNLAALDELAASRERKDYLDAQNDDLLVAIETLEDAIRRIDKETREQLQSTYDFVSRHFGELFPELFGGGQAGLVLTGEEILDAGVQIVAQPPGKKNASIHLLSGGEKALTAIALVFSMFQLNPAPFCMLDEVDAPLDDANTGRYGAMVRRMSAQTQFVFITHSKITMEIAQQLVGVTMQEQGVSRVVEVDIEEALRLADAVPA
ncbi:MAG: chromosome segregation protein SMC [Rhodocyclaceae bacterium]|nr:chromosome segregation protein SMC [Rhodocyclaceae bacterium]